MKERDGVLLVLLAQPRLPHTAAVPGLSFGRALSLTNQENVYCSVQLLHFEAQASVSLCCTISWASLTWRRPSNTFYSQDVSPPLSFSYGCEGRNNRVTLNRQTLPLQQRLQSLVRKPFLALQKPTILFATTNGRSSGKREGSGARLGRIRIPFLFL